MNCPAPLDLHYIHVPLLGQSQNASPHVFPHIWGYTSYCSYNTLPSPALFNSFLDKSVFAVSDSELPLHELGSLEHKQGG